MSAAPEIQFDEEDLQSSAEGLRRRIVNARGPYSEILAISPDGSLELPTRPGDPGTSFFVQIGSESPECLMGLAQAIQQRFPDLSFTFERDPEGKWFKHTVTKVE